MHVKLDGSEVTEALAAFARKKLGVAEGERCACDAAIYTGERQLDPERCMAVVRITRIETRAAPGPARVRRKPG